MRRRIARHHLVIALFTGISLLVTYALVASKNPVFRWSMATAYVGLALLVLTLATGPVNVIRRRPNPVSTDLRRDLGVWAGLVALAHFVIGWQVHMKHRYLYWLREVKGTDALRPRTDLFGFANYTGLAAVLIAVLLLVLSNDYSLTRLGSRRWKRLQRWSYAFFALSLVHGVAYQIIEKRKAPCVAALVALTLTALAVQYVGFIRRTRQSGERITDMAAAFAEHAGRPQRST